MEPYYTLDQDDASDMGYIQPIARQQPETSLWRAVLARAIKDAIGTDYCSERHRGISQKRANNWFYYADEDFKKVCEFAGLDPENVQFSVLDYLTKPEQNERRVSYTKDAKRPVNGKKTPVVY